MKHSMHAEYHPDPDWTKEETDYLFQLVEEYDSRFYIVYDRYEYPGDKTRTLEVVSVDIYHDESFSWRTLGHQRPVLQRVPEAYQE